MQTKFIDIYLKICRFSSTYKPAASTVETISSSITNSTYAAILSHPSYNGHIHPLPKPSS